MMKREEVQAQWTGSGMLGALKKEKDSSDWFTRLKNVDVTHETCFNMN